MKKYIVEEAPLQATLDYLSSRPFSEVALLIGNLKNVAGTFDENLKFTQADLDRAYNEGLGIGFEKGSNASEGPGHE